MRVVGGVPLWVVCVFRRVDDVCLCPSSCYYECGVLCYLFLLIFENGSCSQIAFLRWPNVGSTLYTTMAHGRHTTLDQCSFDRWHMVG